MFLPCFFCSVCTVFMYVNVSSRTKPLVVASLSTPRHSKRATSVNITHHGDPAAATTHGDPEGQDHSPERPAGEEEARTAGGSGTATATTTATAAATTNVPAARSVSWDVPGPTGEPLDGSGARGGGRGLHRGGRGGGRRSARVGRGGGRAPLLLSWEDLRYEIAVPRRRSAWFGTENAAAASGGGASGWEEGGQGLLILDGVSGLAGPTNRRAAAAAARGAGVDLTEAGLVAASTPAPASSTQREGKGGRGDDADGWEGTVTAIMGPSGAGKTSLLNALAGRLQTAQGRSYPTRRGDIGGGSGSRSGGFGLTGAVRLNGEGVSAAQVRTVSAYVTQEDVLPETLTCYEHLMFHAHLRLPAQTSLARRNDRVMEVSGLGLRGVVLCWGRSVF